MNEANAASAGAEEKEKEKEKEEETGAGGQGGMMQAAASAGGQRGLTPENAITVEQLPVIAERLAQMAETIRGRASQALSLEVSEENIALAKRLRAALNKEFEAFEERRKTIKRAVLAPYEVLEIKYRECVAEPYGEADEALKKSISALEREAKDRKRAALRAYWDELAGSRGIDFIRFDTLCPGVTLSQPASAYRKELKAYADKIAGDLALISGQENAAEVLAEYRKLPDLGTAMRAAEERRRQIAEAERHQAEQRAREERVREARAKAERAIAGEAGGAPPGAFEPAETPAEAPPEAADPVKTAQFAVRGALSKLRALKEYIASSGLELIGRKEKQMTEYITVQLPLKSKPGEYGGRAYTYICGIPGVKPGDVLIVPAGAANAETAARVAETGVPESRIDERIMPALKSAIRRAEGGQ